MVGGKMFNLLAQFFPKNNRFVRWGFVVWLIYYQVHHLPILILHQITNILRYQLFYPIYNFVYTQALVGGCGVLLFYMGKMG